MDLNNSSDKINEASNSDVDSTLGESMGNMFQDIDKEHTHLIYGYYPKLDKKEICVCKGFCSAIWDTNYHTTPDIVIEYVIREGKSWYMKENRKPLFSNEEEVKVVIERLKQKGVMWTTIGNTINGFRGQCRSRLCPHVFYHLVRYLNMKPQIENDAWLITSRCFEGAVQLALGPIKPEEQ